MSDSEENPLLNRTNPADNPQPSSWLRRCTAGVQSWLKKQGTYHTAKEVRILNRRLGYVYYTCFLFIALYLVVGVFILDKKYLDKEQVKGFAYPRINGKAISSNYPWDSIEQNPWGRETNSVFIPSKVIITAHQTNGLCADPLLTCNSDADCESIDLPNVIESSECLTTSDGKQGCASWRWCPPESESDSTEHYLENASEEVIWIRYKLGFKRLSDSEKTNLDASEYTQYPERGTDAWEVSDITQLGGSNFSDIVQYGAVFQAKFMVTCLKEWEESCDTHLEVRRLDAVDGNGYSTFYAYYYREQGILLRDLYHMHGVKILFTAEGFYVAPSLYLIVLQLASAMGLLILTGIITDTISVMWFKEKRHITELKQIESEDFHED